MTGTFLKSAEALFMEFDSIILGVRANDITGKWFEVNPG